MYSAIVFLPLLGAILAGIILLVAMVGAIVLTLRHRVPVKRQDMAAQVRRTHDESIELVKMRPGQGLT